MGFFDKIKSAVNVVTGGAAEVNVSFGEVKFGEPIELNISALAKSDLKIEKVYLHLKGVEEVRIEDKDYQDKDGDGDREETRETIEKHFQTYEMEQVISGAQELENGQEYQWTTEIQIPDHLQAPYKGQYCSHTYKVFIGLDAFGNDPDTGWVNIPF